MFSKLRTLTAVCSVAVLAISAVALACPNDKQVSASVKSQCGSQKTAAVQVANVGQKQCSKSRKASTVAVASVTSTKKAGCPKAAATTETLALLAKAIRTMPDDASRASVVTAYRTMAKANPDLVCEKQCASVKAVLAGGAACGTSAKTIAVAGKSGAASGCCASKGAKTRNTQVANNAACDPAACRAAKATNVSDAAAHAAACAAAKAKGTKVAFGTSTCSKSKQARYVAFGCNKTDKLARTAARAYLDLIRELKTYSGADGCAVSTASKLLAQMIQDDSARADASDPVVVVVDVPVVETVSNIETTVSLGAVSDVKKSKRSQCSSSKK
jgi:hypothetical protein